MVAQGLLQLRGRMRLRGQVVTDHGREVAGCGLAASWPGVRLSCSCGKNRASSSAETMALSLSSTSRSMTLPSSRCCRATGVVRDGPAPRGQAHIALVGLVDAAQEMDGQCAMSCRRSRSEGRRIGITLSR